MEPEPFNLALEAHGIAEKVEDLQSNPLSARQAHLYNVDTGKKLNTDF